MAELMCRIRRVRVSDLPEERVRQDLIARMISELGYPEHSLAVEKALNQFPHLQAAPHLPDCRVDIACLASGIHSEYPLFPLIVIECKAVTITSRVLEQVIGYNFYCQAPFIAVVNQHEIRFGWNSGEKYEYIDNLPPYQELMNSIL